MNVKAEQAVNGFVEGLRRSNVDGVHVERISSAIKMFLSSSTNIPGFNGSFEDVLAAGIEAVEVKR
jgi:hypothetical protein